ncbi:MAG TPA: Hsp70 family protein [Polyangiaceae bacterium]|nr:Hsp70 family protein [Polyangiaceae bacterium]
MTARSVVGIDLGTTHTALAYADEADEDARSTPLDVPQLTAPGVLERQPLLPSFLYFAHESEPPLSLPWDASRRYTVGEYARRRASEAPGRVVSSAKSWLSHPSVDRRAPIIPLNAPEDVEKVSPVEASFRYLDHLAEAWKAAGHESDLAEQSIVLAVPASFDASARDLTVEAAFAAGMEGVTLLEEPQAALYAWIESVGDEWRKLLRVGDVVLIVDIGGGTTDFSAVEAVEADGGLELRRVAVGDHILLGGDNMDLALAHVAKARLESEGHELDAWQLHALMHASRAAKERLLSSDAESVPVVVPSRGSQLLGGSLRTVLERAEVERTIVDGFFPEVAVSDEPARRARTALTQMGLPYAADPAITRHLAAFLRRQAGAVNATASSGLLRPSAVLFNGGVLKSNRIRSRILDPLGRWLRDAGAPAPRELPAADLDLAVARGACYYGLVRKGRGLRIRGGTAQAYYVGIESPAPAVPGVPPPITAFCVAPFGVEEGSRVNLPPHELGVVVGEPVRFRFFGSSVRREDAAGDELTRWKPGELSELSPIELTLPAEGRHAGEVVPVRLESGVTPIGTLALEAVPLNPRSPDERWKVELSVRTDR